MKSDKRAFGTEIAGLISQIDVSSVLRAQGALLFAFEQLLALEFNTSTGQEAAFAAFRGKIDELNEVATDEQILELGNTIADKINAFGMLRLDHATAGGCEYLTNHLIVRITQQAPGLNLDDLEIVHRVLNAHIFRPNSSEVGSATDRVAGTDRGFNRGQVAHAI